MYKEASEAEIDELRQSLLPVSRKALDVLYGFQQRDADLITEGLIQMFIEAEKAGLTR